MTPEVVNADLAGPPVMWTCPKCHAEVTSRLLLKSAEHARLLSVEMAARAYFLSAKAGNALTASTWADLRAALGDPE